MVTLPVWRGLLPALEYQGSCVFTLVGVHARAFSQVMEKRRLETCLVYAL